MTADNAAAPRPGGRGAALTKRPEGTARRPGAGRPLPPLAAFVAGRERILGTGMPDLLALRLLAACGGDLERARARLDRAAEVAA